jgi:glycosyltransferase involved in cell wall biosynthesis
MTVKTKLELSVVIPVFNEAAVLPLLYQRLCGVIAPWATEIIFVDDGSSDGSRDVLQALAQTDARVKVVGLSRNFGHERATTAGLRFASGDVVVLMDADLQDPPEVIPHMMRLWQDEGYDVVYGMRQRRHGESMVKRGTSALFYRVLNWLAEVPIPRDVGDFRLMSRRVVHAMNQMNEHRRFIRGMVAWLGYRQIGIPYVRDARYQGKTKYSLRKLAHLSLEAIIAFSERPLKLGTRLGFIVAVLGLVLAGRTILIKVQHPGAIIPGWASVFVAILVLGGINLIVTGIVGEYVGRVLDEVRGRPLFLVEYTENVGSMDTLPPVDSPTLVRERRLQRKG